MNKHTNGKDFALPMFFKVKSGDDVDLRIYVRAMALVEDDGLFRQKLSLDPSRFEPSQLVESLSNLDDLKNIMNLECAAYKADFLCDDPMVAEKIIKKLEGPLGQALKEKGLRLIRIERFGARRLEIEEQIKEDLRLEDSIDRLLLDAEKKGLLKHDELERFKKNLTWEGEDKERDQRLEQLRKDYEEKRLKLSLEGELDREQFAKENRLLRGWLLDRLEIENRLASYRRQEQIREAEKERRITKIKEGKGFPWWGSVVVTLAVVGIALGIWTVVAGHFPPWVERGDGGVTSYILVTTVSPPEGGSISPSSGKYDSGNPVALTAASTAGYRFSHWSGDASGTGTTTTLAMNSNKNVVANFVAVGYSLSTSASPPGSGSVTPSSGTYNSGASVTLTASPNPGYRFVSWSGDITGTSPTITVNMDSNKSVTANFVAIRYSLSTSVSPSGSGSVSPGSGSYDAGTSVTLTASLNPRYRFVSWSGDITGTSPTITINMDSNKSVTANFMRQFTLSTSVSPSGGGSISVSPSSGPYDAGNRVTLTATPASEYYFVSWSGDATGTSPTITVTMDRDKSVTAKFEKPQEIIYYIPQSTFLWTSWVRYSNNLQTGERVIGTVRLEHTGSLGELLSYSWKVEIFDPADNLMSTWTGDYRYDQVYPIDFLASYSGAYKIKVTNYSGYSKTLRITIRPPSWG